MKEPYIQWREEKDSEEMLKDEAQNSPTYPQAQEENEYRYLSPAWLDEVARGLTAGAQKYPGETWRTIPAKEHAWRAVRHLILYLKGDKGDTHLVNASMRCMMALETSGADREKWEGLMNDYERGRLND